jgi:hypothetical protein
VEPFVHWLPNNIFAWLKSCEGFATGEEKITGGHEVLINVVCSTTFLAHFMMKLSILGWLFDYTHDYSGSFFLGGSFLTVGSLLLIIPYIKHKREVRLTTVQLTEQVKATSFGSMLGSQYLEAMRSHDELR